MSAASFETINELLNTKAREIAREYGYRTDNFIVSAHTSIKDNATSMLIPGSTVEIHVLFPDILPEFKTIIRGWLRYINRTSGIWTPMVLANHYFVRPEERIKWDKVIKRRLSNDPADEFPELIPQHRVTITTETTVTYTDTVTKTSHSITTRKVEPLRTRNVDTSWRILSNLVREQHPDAANEVDGDDSIVGEIEPESHAS